MSGTAAVVFKAALEQLYKNDNLSTKQCSELMELIAAGEADPVQIGALLVLMHQKGETADEIAAFAAVLRTHCTKVSAPAGAIDIVGTGGDGHDTVNISTSAAVVIAACGVVVAKHGNRSVSSKSGSTDVLEKLGVPMLGPSDISECIDEAGIAFMTSTLFHPAVKHVVPVRRALGVKTVFNTLGPLLNPAGVKRMMLGVYSPELAPIYAQALFNLGVEHALVVNAGGLDELAPVGNVVIFEVKPSGVTELVLDTDAEGIPACAITDLKGGDAVHNAGMIRAVFAGGEGAEGAVGHTIALNAGAGLYVGGKVNSIGDGYRMALGKMKSGDVLKTMDKWAEVATGLHAKRQKVV